MNKEIIDLKQQHLLSLSAALMVWAKEYYEPDRNLDVSREELLDILKMSVEDLDTLVRTGDFPKHG